MLAPLVAGVVYIVGRRYRRISQRIQNSVSSITGIVDEVVSGQREVKVYGGQDYERARFGEANATIRHLNLKVASTNALATALVQLVAACALALVIFLATRPGTLRAHEPGHVHVADHGDAGDAAVAQAADHGAGEPAARRRRRRRPVRA